ncbi:MAG: 5-formyltetrahydrofolate cyclo-ligase [Oleiphilaceae bacterium]|jgi:5-formyltetrahydrofolate cyclo-ligase
MSILRQNSLISSNRKTLRAKVRAQRRALSPRQQKTANARLYKQLERSLILLRAKHIALYLGTDGEICPKALISHYLKRKKLLYLPVLHPLKKNHMVFCPLTAATKLKKNQFGILEPDFRSSVCIPPKQLSLVLLPLVAFDTKGNRIGMGGGYYDRAFEFKQKTLRHSPRLIGLAHDLQKQEQLPKEYWDIPLFAIFTDQEIYLS